MGKKDNLGNIMDYIQSEYIFNNDLNKIGETMKYVEMLVDNDLAVKIAGTEDLSSFSLSRYRLICKFMCDLDKSLKKHVRRDFLRYEYGSSIKFADDDPKITELAKYSLDEGKYGVDLGKDNFAILNIFYPDKDDPYYIGYELYFVGRKCMKWKDKFFKILDEYKELKEIRKIQSISYSDDTDTKVAKFKSMDTLIIRNKKEIINYIDNWVNNIPKYFYEFNMIPRLSLIISGEPGTGKSTFYKALADYLDISDILCLKPSFFTETRAQYDSGRRRNYGGGLSIVPKIIAIDDIDCVCKARSEYATGEESAEDTGEEKKTEHTNSEKSSTSDGAKENEYRLSNLLAYLDNPDTFYFKAKDGLYYPVQIVVATTNLFHKLDPAVVRPGRFDKHIEMHFFDETLAREMAATYKLKLEDVITEEIDSKFKISPSKLQAKCIEHVDSEIKNGTMTESDKEPVSVDGTPKKYMRDVKNNRDDNDLNKGKKKGKKKNGKKEKEKK